MTFIEHFDIGVKKMYAPDVLPESGYFINNKTYPAYMDNCSWEAFLKEMREQYPRAFAQYGAGGGGELKPQRSRPPKMASYASSSRMIYLLARDKDSFEFEKDLSFTIGGVHTTAYLDGFLKRDRSYIFVEAKCREIYASKASLKVNKKYMELYDFICRRTNGQISAKPVPGACDPDEQKISFTVSAAPISHFDLKQMICHLLGIGTAVLHGDYTDAPIAFQYLLFNPTDLDICQKYKDKILSIYHQAIEECGRIDFKNLFRIILEYLMTKNNSSPADFSSVIDAFSFEICDQTNFKDKIMGYAE